MDKYNTLLAAVLALEPFNKHFQVVDYDCIHCEAILVKGCIHHTPECPVTLLRNIISTIQEDAHKQKQLDKAVSFITSPTDNGV